MKRKKNKSLSITMQPGLIKTHDQTILNSPATIQLKDELSNRLYSEGVPNLPLPSIKRVFDDPEPGQRPITAKIYVPARKGFGTTQLIDFSTMHKDALTSVLKKVIPAYEIKKKTKEQHIDTKRPSQSIGRNTQWNAKLIQEKRLTSLYADSNNSITGMNITNALRPRLNMSIDRSNVYALKVQPQKIGYLNLRRLPSIKEGEINQQLPQIVPETIRTQLASERIIQKTSRVNQSLLNYPSFDSTEFNIEETREVSGELNDLNSFLKALLQKRPEAIAKFLYFNLKGLNPYELEVTSYANRCVDKYFTVSYKGVTRYDKEVATEMVTLKEWLVEKELYKELKTFSFFKNFHKWKMINSWKTRIYIARKKRITEELEDKMFFLDPIYRDHLLKYRRYINAIAKLRVVDLNKSANVSTLEEFGLRQEQKRKETEKKIKEFSMKAREIIRDLINQSLDKLREKMLSETIVNNNQSINQLSTDDDPNSGNTALRKLNFPVIMNYGHRVTLRRECLRFLKLAYLVDFMVIKSLSDIYIESIRELVDMLSYLDENAQVEINAGHDILRKTAKVEPIFLVKINIDIDKPIPKEAIKQIPINPFNDKTCKAKEFDLACHIEMNVEKETSRVPKRLFKLEVENIGGYWIEPSPSKEVVYEQLLDHLSEGLRVLESFERWSRHEELQKYVDVLENWDNIVGGDWGPPEDDSIFPIVAIEDNPIYLTHRSILKSLFDSGYSKCHEFLKSLNKYLNICWRDKATDVGIICDQRICKPGETLTNVIRLFDYQKKTFTLKLPETCNLGLLKIDCRPVRKVLIPIPSRCISEVEHLVNYTAATRLSKAESWITSARESLEMKVETVDDYIKQRIAWNEVANGHKDIKEMVDIVGEFYDVMQIFQLRIKKDNKQKYVKILQEMGKLTQLLGNVSDQQELDLDKNKKKIQDQLVPSLQQSLETLKRQIEDEVFLTYQENIKENIDKVNLLENQFKNLSAQCDKYKNYQERLNLEVCHFEIVKEITEQLNLRKTLWNSLKEWKELTEKWTEQQFSAINPKEIDITAEDYLQIALRLDNGLPENPVSKQLKLMVDTFAKAVPIIKSLRNELLKKSHWKDIKTLIKAEFEITDPGFTLRSLFDLEAQKCTIEIQQISAQATRENLLERKITSIDNKCRSCTFVIKDYFKEDFIVSNIDDIRDLLCQCLTDIAAILEDKYIGPFLDQAESWQKILIGLIDIMEEWAICQSQWMNLGEIFSSNEIRTQLVSEGVKFDVPDKFFKGLIQKAIKTPNPLKLIKSYKGDLLEQLKRTNKIMDEIRRLLSDYIENKQAAFPRFYFLASNEVLQVLSNTQRLNGIEMYLPKLFDSVAKISFNENGDTIGVVSRQGEKLQLFRPMRVKDSIEGCLEQLEVGIKETLIRLMRTAITDYDEMERNDWIIKYNAQIVLVISKIVWCNATENTILEQTINSNALIEWYEELVHEVQQTIELAKNNTLASHIKISLYSTLLSQMHCKDIIEELILAGITFITDYNWQKVLKFYWEDEDTSLQQFTFISIKAFSYKLLYGSEYVAPVNLTVNNPLTDRSWLSIVSALSSHMAVGLLGAHEIGKTETLRCLAKNMGIYFIDMNCLKESNYKLFFRFIAGALYEGAWICIQGLDRIDLGILSVISRQLLDIKHALDKSTQSLLINEKEIQVKEGFAVVSTITQQKVMKTKLIIENFRIVSMIEPEIEHILEVWLLIENFNNTKVLANRLVMLRNIVKDLLRDYPFGIQCLKTIISTAAALKKSVSSIKDDVAIMTGIKLLLEPKIEQTDIETFNSIVADIFPNVKPYQMKNSENVKLLEQVLETNGLSKIPKLIEKSIQIMSLLKSSTGIIVIGPPASGKSIIIKILCEAYNLKNKKKITLSRINPKAVTLTELYGTSNLLTQEWIDGLIPKILREITTDQWLVLDGPITSDWADIINPVITQLPVLSLGNNERIYPIDNTKIFFESDNLKNSSPSTVSRCGLICLSNNCITYKPYVESWLNSNYSGSTCMTADLKQHILQLFEQSIDRALMKVRSSCDELVNMNDCQFISSICNIMETMLVTENFIDERFDKKKMFSQIYCFAFIWGVGGSLDEGGREKIDSIARSLFENSDVPTAQSVFEYYVDPNKGTGFRLWSDIVLSFNLQSDSSFSNILVPNIETVRQKYFVECLVDKCKNIFITGNSSCGKSVIMKDIIERSDMIYKIGASFSSGTKTSTIQLYIENKLQKVRNGLYGTAEGKRNLIFIDDAHLPFNNNSTTELFRQLIDQKGWYNRYNLLWKGIENTSLMCIGKSNDISMRFKRHFNEFFITAISNSMLEHIFKVLLENHMKSKSYAEILHSFIADIASTTIYAYNYIGGKLKSGIGKFTHIINPRDLFRVVEGMSMANSDMVNSVETLANLWMNEFSRVFVDGVMEENDKDWIGVLISDSANKIFKVQVDLRTYWNFERTVEGRIYKEVNNLNELKNFVEDKIRQYVKINPEAFNVVLYGEMIEILLKIIHGLEQSRGHLLIVGNSGTGKSTLIKFAAFIQQINVREFKREPTEKHTKKILKQLLMSSGIQGNYETFLINQKTYNIPDEVLEMIHLLLVNEQIPGLFSQEEIEKILTDMRPIAIESKRNLSHKALYNIFKERIEQRLKIVFSCKPEKWLHESMRRFPSLIKSCRMICISDWSFESIQIISKKTLTKLDKYSEESKDLISNLCREIHTSVIAHTEQFNKQCHTTIKITSSFYIDALRQFIVLADKQEDETINTKDNFVIGYNNYKEFKTNNTISDTELQTLLNNKSELIEQLQKEIVNQQKLINDIENTLTTKTQTIEQEDNQLKSESDEIENELNLLKPELNSVLENLVQCDKKHFANLESELYPKSSVKLVMEAVMTLLGEKTDWTNIKSFLGKPNELLSKLTAEKSITIESSTIKKVQTGYINSSEFDTEENIVTKLFAQWVRATLTYCKECEKILPRQKQWEIAKQKLDKETEELKVQHEELEKQKQKFTQLKINHDNLQIEKTKLAGQILESRTRSDKVDELLSIFIEDELRWDAIMAQRKNDQHNNIGNLLFASIFIVYIGQFPIKFREKLISEWTQKIKSMGLIFDENLYLKSDIERKNIIKDLYEKGVPKSQYSVDNSIIVLNSYKWPLIIDPHSFANKWIKNEFKKQGLLITKFSQKDYLQTLIYAMRMGKPLLIEDIEDVIEPIIKPILSRSTIAKNTKTVIVYMDGKEYECDSSFRLFMTTKGNIPINVDKVSVVNFDIDPISFEEMILNNLLVQEIPDEVRESKVIVKEIERNENVLIELNDKMMTMFANGPLLDLIEDSRTYDSLKSLNKNYKETVMRLSEDKKHYEKYMERIKEYKKITNRACIIFSVVLDFSLIFPELKFSLQNFIEVFMKVIKLSSAIPRSERIKQLKDKVTNELCNFIEQTMYRYHKILFAFFVSIKIQEMENKVKMDALDYFVKDCLKTDMPNLLSNVIDTKGWALAQTITQYLPQFSGFLESLSTNTIEWEAYGKNDGVMPDKWKQSLSSIDKLVVSRVFHKRKLYSELIEFIRKSALPVFLEDNKRVDSIFSLSKKMAPIILIPSTEISSVELLQEYVVKKKCQEKFSVVSLGPDQGQQVKKCLQNSQIKGDWILVDNCQYAEGGIAELETIIEQIKEPKNPSHEDFKVFFSVVKNTKLPKSLIDCGIKLLIEDPEGLKERTKLCYSLISDMECIRRPKEFKRVLLGLVMFHAVVNEASVKGGFSQQYQFSTNHLIPAADTIRNLMEESEDTFWNSIEFAVGEILYCESILDKSDKQKLMGIFKAFCGKDILDVEYSPLMCEGYAIPEDHQNYLDNLPDKELFGIIDFNWESKAIEESNKSLIQLINDLQFTNNIILEERLESISMINWISGLIETIPMQLHTTVGSKELFQDTPSPLTIVLISEIKAYNSLLKLMLTSLQMIKDCLLGNSMFTEQTEEMWFTLKEMKVPKSWQDVTCSTKRSLMDWIKVTTKKVEFIRNWMTNGEPKGFWAPAFISFREFLAGLTQQHIKKYKVTAEKQEYKFEVLKGSDKGIQERPEDGAIIYGLHLYNGTWHKKNEILDLEGNTNIMPPIHIKIIPIIEDKKGYLCPVYNEAMNDIIAYACLPIKENSNTWIMNRTSLVIEPGQ